MLWLRFFKFLGLFLLLAGTLSVVLPLEMPQQTRRRLAFGMAAPGLLTVWGAGLLLANLAGHSLLSIWIVASFGLTLLSIQAVIYCAAKEGRAGVRASAVAVIPLVATLALMIWRPS